VPALAVNLVEPQFLQIKRMTGIVDDWLEVELHSDYSYFMVVTIAFA
jgi:hypothetical protein